MSNIEQGIQNSALWAAAGDALGWISELVDHAGLRRRAGESSLSRTIPWKRKIGGLGGIEAPLPAGTYSDDTQLRLAVGRAIRSDGSFDVEAFAKIELPVWATYALGAGRGTRAAAANLVKRDVNWFSNFFSSKGSSYVNAGGNGAAMRIQPHVWANASNLKGSGYLTGVVKDSLVTHGHMVGVCGALFHAQCLAHVFSERMLPGPDDWMRFVDDFYSIDRVVRSDGQLSQFWLGAWEQLSKTSLDQAIAKVADLAKGYVRAAKEASEGDNNAYTFLLDSMECRGRFLGAGINTAIAAAYLAWTSADAETAVLRASNAIGSDTDTIGTMAGALSGVLAEAPLDWQLQDRGYILSEARRMFLVTEKRESGSFSYPDLSVWRSPRMQWDAVGVVGGRTAVKGLGFGEFFEDELVSPSASWRWIRLDFGQTILCKFRTGKLIRFQKDQLPGVMMYKDRANPSAPIATTSSERSTVKSGDPHTSGLFDGVQRLPESSREGAEIESIDELTNRVIRSGFDSKVLGECFKLCLSGADSIERGIAFSAIVGKAILARRRKGQ